MWHAWETVEVDREFGAENWGKETLGWSRRRLKDNFKVDLQEVGWGLNWIGLTQDKDRWRAVVSAVMNIGFP
jgi:hypothetical protein